MALLESIRTDVWAVWPQVAELWNSGKDVTIGPIGPAARWTDQGKVLNEIIALDKQGIEILSAHVNDHSSNVAAYCIMGLGILGYWKRNELPDSLRSRKQVVTVKMGCFSNTLTLEEMAELEVLKAKR